MEIDAAIAGVGSFCQRRSGRCSIAMGGKPQPVEWCFQIEHIFTKSSQSKSHAALGGTEASSEQQSKV